MSDPIVHHERCSRPAPLLRRSWDGKPEWWCSACGRFAAATETKETR